MNIFIDSILTSCLIRNSCNTSNYNNSNNDNSKYY